MIDLLKSETTGCFDTFCEYMFASTHIIFGRIARANAFETMFRVMMDDGVDIELFMLGSQKLIRIFYTRTVLLHEDLAVYFVAGYPKISHQV